MFRIVCLTLIFHTISAEKYSLSKCRTDIDCKPNAYCNAALNLCECQTGYEMFTLEEHYECLQESKLGGSCQRDIQCELTAGSLAICSDNKCECNPRISHAIGTVCYETKALGDFCRVDENCKLLDDQTFAMCNYGVCTCPLGKHATESKQNCVESRKIDEICENDQQCQATKNAVCQTVCTCQAGFALGSELECLKAALKFGDSCIEDIQCSRYLESSVCNNSTCSCPFGTQPLQTVCEKVGNTCFSNDECRRLSLEFEGEINCVNGVCTNVLLNGSAKMNVIIPLILTSIFAASIENQTGSQHLRFI